MGNYSLRGYKQQQNINNNDREFERLCIELASKNFQDNKFVIYNMLADSVIHNQVQNLILSLKYFKNGIYMTDENKNNLAMLAVNHKSLECLLFLIDNKIDLNYQNCYGQTCSMFAVKDDEHHILKILLDNNINLNIQDRTGDTIIIHCAKYGSYKCLDLLIQQGANIHALNFEKQNALYYAGLNGEIKCYKLLIFKYYNIFFFNKNIKYITFALQIYEFLKGVCRCDDTDRIQYIINRSLKAYCLLLLIIEFKHFFFFNFKTLGI